MEKEKENGNLLKALRDIPIYLAVVGAFFWLSIRVHSIDVIDRRLEKKIKVQNEIIDELLLLKMDYELKIQEFEMRIEALEKE